VLRGFTWLPYCRQNSLKFKKEYIYIYTCLRKMLITNLHYIGTAQILCITATNKFISPKTNIKYVYIARYEKQAGLSAVQWKYELLNVMLLKMHRLYVQKCTRTLQHYVQVSTKLSHAYLPSRNGNIYTPFDITLLSWLRALFKSLTWTVISRWQHSLYLSTVYRIPLTKNHVDES